MIKERLVSALIGTLLFAIFQPLGLSQFGWMRFPLLAGIFLTVVSSCFASEYVVQYLFRMPYSTERDPAYAIRRGVLFQLCNMTLMPLLLAFYFDRFVSNETIDNHLSWQKYLWLLVVCIFASLIIGLYWRTVYWKRYYFRQLEEAQLLNGVLMERARLAGNKSATEEAGGTSTPTAEERILLEGTTKERLSLLPEEFIYAESEGNYVGIHYLAGESCRQAMLRTSIKSVAARLCTHDNIMQCHRAYIVNLHMVEQVEGRSSGIGLQMRHCKEVVPVSKVYVNGVKERIKNPDQPSH